MTTAWPTLQQPRGRDRARATAGLGGQDTSDAPAPDTTRAGAELRGAGAPTRWRVPASVPAVELVAWTGGGPAAARTVADVMVTAPKTLPICATVGQVRRVFADDHVVMVLLTEGGVLCGAVVRDDLPADSVPYAPALPLSHLTGRTVAPTASATTVFRWLLASGQRRLAVVDSDGRLLGMVCLKRRRTGFCTDAGVAARAAAAKQVRALPLAPVAASDVKAAHAPRNVGATAEQAAAHLPGDELASDPAENTTLAVSVPAAAERVWA